MDEVRKKGHGRREKPVTGLPLLIGRKPVLEALQQGETIEKIFLLRSASGPEIRQIFEYAGRLHIPVSKVPVEKLNRLTRVNHQGVVAWAGLVSYGDIQMILSQVFERGEEPLFVLLDGVTDVRNVGAIARTAYCCGAHGLILPISSSAALTEEAMKASAGALRKLPICRTPSLAQAVDVLKLNGLQVMTLETTGSEPLHDVDFSMPLCVILGSEGKGVSRDASKRRDVAVHIPMVRDFDSFNVSVAGGMVFYEIMRQRMNLRVSS